MAEQQTSPFDFVDRSFVPDRVWNKEGPFINERIAQMREALGGNLVKVVLHPNAGHINYGTGHALNGAVLYVKKGTPLQAVAPFLAPMYQHVSVFDLGNVSDEKIRASKAQWQAIIDPVQTRGSGIPGVGVNDSVDIVHAYMMRGKMATPSWSTSLGPKYQGVLGGIYRAPNGNAKLYLSGGHESAHRSLLNAMIADKDLKVEDLADRKFVLDSENSLSQMVEAIKDIQKINHSVIAGKVMSALGCCCDGKQQAVKMDPYNNFSMPVDLTYSCFVNTVREVAKQGSSGTYAITQGVVDTNYDIEIIDKASDKIDFYMVESPLRVHQLSVNRDFLDKVRYFPLTTGCSENNPALGMNEKDRQNLRDNLQWTGVLGIHNASSMHYQPYDTTLKLHTNALFSNQCFAIVQSDVALEGVMYTVSGLDPRPLSTDDYLKHTQHMPTDAVIRVPATSPPVSMIFNTFPHVLDELNRQGLRDVELFNVVKTDDISNHFVQVPVGSMRIASHMAKKTFETDVIDTIQGLPRLE